MDKFNLKEYLKHNRLLKESRIKFDDFTLEVHEDFSSTPAIILPSIEFETDGDGFALANENNISKVGGFRDEIKAMYTLFGSESGVKDKNDLYISIEDIISQFENKTLKENDLEGEGKFDYDDPNSPISQLNDDDQAISQIVAIQKKYGKDVLQYWITSGEWYDEYA